MLVNCHKILVFFKIVYFTILRHTYITALMFNDVHLHYLKFCNYYISTKVLYLVEL